ncbi:MAG TPA: hypothetical protein VET65_02235 [Candidatus Limnocylindrales bacterium]|nr:hypothetical protein [Candidatus Limnocylindrales bacterium]
MLLVEVRRLEVAPSSDQFWTIVSRINGPEFMGVLYRAREAIFDSAGISFTIDLLSKFLQFDVTKSWSNADEGELFFGSAPVVGWLRVRRPGSATLRELRSDDIHFMELEHAGKPAFVEVGVAYRPGGEKIRQDFLKRVRSAASEVMGQEIGTPSSWPVLAPVGSHNFEAIRKTRPASLDASAEENQAIAAFTTPEIRALIRDLERVGSLTVSDLPKVLGEAQGAAVAARLGEIRNLGLIQSEYVIVCSRTGNAVLRTDDPNKLSKMAPDWMKCACGKALSEERVDQVIMPTKWAAELNDRGRWMTTLVSSVLPRIGISRDSVIVEATPTGTDIILDLSGDLVLVVLKDREFNLADAYAFNSKVSRIKASEGVIVTNEGLSGDARKLLTEEVIPRRATDPFRITYVEGTQNLEHELGRVVERRRRNYFLRALGDLATIQGLNIGQLALAKVEAGTRAGKEAVVEAVPAEA